MGEGKSKKIGRKQSGGSRWYMNGPGKRENQCYVTESFPLWSSSNGEVSWCLNLWLLAGQSRFGAEISNAWKVPHSREAVHCVRAVEDSP